MLFECLLWQVHEHRGLQNHQKGILWTSEQILGSKMPLQNGKMSLCWCLLKMLQVCFNLNMISSSKNHFIFTPFQHVILIFSCWAKLSPWVFCFVLQLWDWIEGNWIVIWYVEQFDVWVLLVVTTIFFWVLLPRMSVRSKNLGNTLCMHLSCKICFMVHNEE
jgi:hypothetical protein